MGNYLTIQHEKNIVISRSALLKKIHLTFLANQKIIWMTSGALSFKNEQYAWNLAYLDNLRSTCGLHV